MPTCKEYFLGTGHQHWALVLCTNGHQQVPSTSSTDFPALLLPLSHSFQDVGGQPGSVSKTPQPRKMKGAEKKPLILSNPPFSDTQTLPLDPKLSPWPESPTLASSDAIQEDPLPLVTFLPETNVRLP